MIVRPEIIQQITSQSTEKRQSITARALLVILRVYQTYLSPMNISACKFYPSCSHYAGEAVERFGARRGVWLTLKRLGRCQPFTRGGFDPVPDAPIFSHAERHLSTNMRSAENLHEATGFFEGGKASAMPFSPSTSGVLTPEASSHSSNDRATRGQELAQ